MSLLFCNETLSGDTESIVADGNGTLAGRVAAEDCTSTAKKLHSTTMIANRHYTPTVSRVVGRDLKRQREQRHVLFTPRFSAYAGGTDSNDGDEGSGLEVPSEERGPVRFAGRQFFLGPLPTQVIRLQAPDVWESPLRDVHASDRFILRHIPYVADRLLKLLRDMRRECVTEVSMQRDCLLDAVEKRQQLSQKRTSDFLCCQTSLDVIESDAMLELIVAQSIDWLLLLRCRIVVLHGEPRERLLAFGCIVMGLLFKAHYASTLDTILRFWMDAFAVVLQCDLQFLCRLERFLLLAVNHNVYSVRDALTSIDCDDFDIHGGPVSFVRYCSVSLALIRKAGACFVHISPWVRAQLVMAHLKSAAAAAAATEIDLSDAPSAAEARDLTLLFQQRSKWLDE